jgi:hypothetical protein
MTDLKTLYDEDFSAWTKQQAKALRAAAHSRSNQPLDWGNLAEEIESLGKSDRRELRSQIARIIRHLLKLQFSPAPDPRRGWFESIVDARTQTELLLQDSPSLKRQTGRMVTDQIGKAIELAIFDLCKFGEIDAVTLGELRAVRYTVVQVLGDWFPPDPEEPARVAEEP